MKVLVINCGSSSLKYKLLDMTNEEVFADGICERIGIEGSRIKHQSKGHDKVVIESPMKNHKEAIQFVIDALTNKEYGVIADMSEINAVGHRIVHGGEAFKTSVVINEEVLEAVKKVSDLAPLHNPANLIGIEACKELMPNVPMVGVFDTAFHQTMPKKSYMYALPYEYYEKYGVRRYGFHGTSHRYVSARVAEIMGKDIKDLKIIVCHLGNGASVCAVKNGVSVDTSMGLTPLEGVPMGTRSGDIDPAIVDFIMKKENITIDQMMEILNKKSGALGLFEKSSDFRDLEDAAKANDERAVLTRELFQYKIAKYVGSYAAAMNGVDVVVFTAGVGENDADMRLKICSYLTYLGLEVNPELNNCRGVERDFATAESKCRAFVIPTNEEVMIARETLQLVK